MKKTFELYGTKYTVTNCAAIPECYEEREDERQNALLVTAKAESGEITAHVVFGWTMPESTEDFTDMCNDYIAWESLCEKHRIEIA